MESTTYLSSHSFHTLCFIISFPDESIIERFIETE